MDEITKPGQDKEQPTSGGKPESTSTIQAKTYTEAELQKAKNDALAAAGRDAKALAEKEASLKAQEEAIKARKAEIEEIEKRIDEAELEAAKGDPEKLREYQAKKSYKDRLVNLENMKKDLDKREEVLNRSKAEHEEEVKTARETLLEIKIWEIGEKYGVDPVLLKDLNLPTVDQIEAVAKRLSEAAPKETITPDSGVTSGTGKPTLEQLGKMPMDDYAAHRKREDPDKFPL
jgi:chromosome segregation ATPase